MKKFSISLNVFFLLIIAALYFLLLDERTCYNLSKQKLESSIWRCERRCDFLQGRLDHCSNLYSELLQMKTVDRSNDKFFETGFTNPP